MRLDKQLTVCAIIPTKNRPEDLELTLHTLLTQSVVPQELIIVDQSADDESRRRVYRLLDRNPDAGIKLKYIRDSQISGAAAARNRAMSVAAADIWLFLDDDVCLESNFIEELLSAYRSYPDAIGVSGIVTNYPRPPIVFDLWSRIFVRGPFHDDRQPVYWNAEKLRMSEPVRVSRMGGGLMSFRSDAIRVSRFDENLSGVSDGEDVDFCARLPEGSLLIIVPSARLVHKLSPAGRSRQHWSNRHARSNHFLYRKNWAGKGSNWLYFAWLNAGYYFIASLASLKAGTLKPWQDLTDGIRLGYQASLGAGVAEVIQPAPAVEAPQEKTQEETVYS